MKILFLEPSLWHTFNLHPYVLLELISLKTCPFRPYVSLGRFPLYSIILFETSPRVLGSCDQFTVSLSTSTSNLNLKPISSSFLCLALLFCSNRWSKPICFDCQLHLDVSLRRPIWLREPSMSLASQETCIMSTIWFYLWFLCKHCDIMPDAQSGI